MTQAAINLNETNGKKGGKKCYFFWKFCVRTKWMTSHLKGEKLIRSLNLIGALATTLLIVRKMEQSNPQDPKSKYIIC